MRGDGDGFRVLRERAIAETVATEIFRQAARFSARYFYTSSTTHDSDGVEYSGSGASVATNFAPIN